MAAQLDVQTLRSVFESRPDILADIQKNAGTRFYPLTPSSPRVVQWLDAPDKSEQRQLPKFGEMNVKHRGPASNLLTLWILLG
jgi:hypothetical protein